MDEIFIEESEENIIYSNVNYPRFFSESKPIYMIIFNSVGEWKLKDITLEKLYNKYINIIESSPENNKDLTLTNMYRLDPEYGSSKVYVLIKKYIFLLCFDKLRFLAFPDKCYIVLIDGIDSELNILKKFINYSDLPFMLRILIGFFDMIIGIDRNNDQEKYSIINREIFIIKQKENKGLEELRFLCQKCSKLKKRIDSVKKIIKILLKNEYIFLFENIFIYYLQCSGKLRSELKSINYKLKTERDNYIINLDSSRNKLLRIQIYFSVVTTFGVIAAIPAAIGGMSEFNSLNFSYLFLIVTFIFVLGLPIIGILIFVFILESKKWLIT